jgi:phage-related minor tail protein
VARGVLQDALEVFRMTDQELTNRFDTIDGQSNDTKHHFDVIDAQLVQINRRFDAVDARFDRVEASIKAEGQLTRAHFDAVAERLTSDIRLIAEGHRALQVKTDQLQLADERLEARQGHLEIRQLALEHRQGELETRE